MNTNRSASEPRTHHRDFSGLEAVRFQTPVRPTEVTKATKIQRRFHRPEQLRRN